MEKNRQYGLDILRIISMMGIIGLHIVVNGESLLHVSSSINLIFLSGMYVLCSCSVNTFAMLTGYLYAEKTGVRSVSLIKLLFITLLYSSLIFLVIRLWKPEWILVSWLHAVLPVLAGRYWYITGYVLLFVLIPYLNIILRKLDKGQFQALLVLLLALLSVFSTAAVPADPFVVQAGYSPLWLVVCYLVGAYIRLYRSNVSRMRLWIALLVVDVAWLTATYYFYPNIIIHLINYNSPFMVLNATLLLSIFSRIRIPSAMGKLICSLSGAAFGVYILHSHILIYDVMIAGNMGWIGQNSFIKCVGAFIGVVAGIYIVCWLIDILRSLLFKQTGLDKLLQRLGAWCDKLLKWNC